MICPNCKTNTCTPLNKIQSVCTSCNMVHLNPGIGPVTFSDPQPNPGPAKIEPYKVGGRKMICPKCNNQGVENQANGKPFWFCRTCRDEIGLDYKTLKAQKDQKIMKVDPNELWQLEEVTTDWVPFYDYKFDFNILSTANIPCLHPNKCDIYYTYGGKKGTQCMDCGALLK